MDRATRQQVEERVATIKEVDMAQRKIVVEDQFGTVIYISLQFVDPLFVAPVAKEIWTIKRSGGDWFLGKRQMAVEKLMPGDTLLQTTGNFYIEGDTVYINGIPIVVPDIDEHPEGGGGSAAGPWVNLLLLNGWQNAGEPFFDTAVRLSGDGSLEFRGHLDAANAVSGSVAFNLPSQFRPVHEISYISDVQVDEDGGFSTARILIKTDGDVTITWPEV